jgi:hypothetical protein
MPALPKRRADPMMDQALGEGGGLTDLPALPVVPDLLHLRRINVAWSVRYDRLSSCVTLNLLPG